MLSTVLILYMNYAIYTSEKIFYEVYDVIVSVLQMKSET